MAENENAWPKLEWLYQQPLSRQRSLLRLHEEAGFSPEDIADIQFRKDLDHELGRIAEEEFRAQCDPSEPDWDPSPFPISADLLKAPPPFPQYLNVYLYFAVRFAAGRIFPPRMRRDIVDADCNETAV